MPRLTVSQLALGTLAVVGATVALLALSGTQSTPVILLLALLALGVGVLAAVRRARPRRGSVASRVVAQGQAPAAEAIPEPERVPR
ncbi:hypothetical protein [Streptacidiphilus jiangxiensis]|uniref:Uncharacterized protein n=1 Tax=Streptacidiphilus jiangxiensis TaxID=235985 RepID=A0A1H7RLD8_STRJI|nr:hypothetical protein [Streptacidiphilus jiangxiensis]SEL60945.1 hypothetical protein SAMN05414137_110193 [Streptacidiphilus jiangxiensis]